MCGIAGVFSIDNVFSQQELENATNLLAHRGPDAEGYFQDEVVGIKA